FSAAVVKEEGKLETLYHLYLTITITQTIIYCNTRKKGIYYLKKCTIVFSLYH
ncbi:hypothetical protein PFDG_05292, partial [Plasmodium falciparum Dd2]